MATFQTKRKHYRQSKVMDDNEHNERPPKRQRRGVSVFQRQLYKRKMWVKEYEAGKDQKRRDKRKVMRGYYRALKDLDREHKQIFGHSVSTRSRRMAKKNGTYYDYQQNQYKNDLRYKQKDTWNEVKRPSYHQRYQQSNWKFLNTKSTQNDDTRFKYKRNKQYTGNGVINFGKKHALHHQKNDDYDDDDEERDRNNKNNNKFIGGARLNSYQKAMMERSKIITEREEIQQQKTRKQAEAKKALDKFERQRKRRHKILSMKNKRGQPNLNAQIGLLLNKIQDNQKKAKQHNISQEHIENEGNDDSDDVNEFLDD